MGGLVILVDVGRSGRGYLLKVLDASSHDLVKELDYEIAKLRDAYDYSAILSEMLTTSGARVDGEFISEKAILANVGYDEDADKWVALTKRMLN